MYYLQLYLYISECDGYSQLRSGRKTKPWSSSIYIYPIFHDVSLNDLLQFIQKPLGMRHIHSKLFPLPLSKLHSLYNSCQENHVTNPNSNEYKLTALVLDIISRRLFKPVVIKKDEIVKLNRQTFVSQTSVYQQRF